MRHEGRGYVSRDYERLRRVGQIVGRRTLFARKSAPLACHRRGSTGLIVLVSCQSGGPPTCPHEQPRNQLTLLDRQQGLDSGLTGLVSGIGYTRRRAERTARSGGWTGRPLVFG
jgi:hypothetical protein